MKTVDMAAVTDFQSATRADRLYRWEPERWPVAPDWLPTLARFLGSAPAQQLGQFVQARLAQGAVVYPPQPFRALELTPLERVKVVILGQDPYHGPGQAEGLAFSVGRGVAVPPSLRNIFKEIARESSPSAPETPGDPPARAKPASTQTAANQRQFPVDGSLEAWARQGVLLLNTCLTVEQGQPASHARQGWEALTDMIIEAVVTRENPIVFMLWGAHAQARQDLLVKGAVRPQSDAAPTVKTAPRLVLTANHPSPLSALRPPQPFIGCDHFSAANAFLAANRLEPIRWA